MKQTKIFQKWLKDSIRVAKKKGFQDLESREITLEKFEEIFNLKQVSKMVKYQLLTKHAKKLKITIDESAKEDFKKMIGWDEFKWDFHTEQIKGRDTNE